VGKNGKGQQPRKKRRLQKTRKRAGKSDQKPKKNRSVDQIHRKERLREGKKRMRRKKKKTEEKGNTPPGYDLRDQHIPKKRGAEGEKW